MTKAVRSVSVFVAAISVLFVAGTAGCSGSESRRAAHIEQGQKFMAERQYEKASLEFRNALQIEPKDARVRELAGLAAEKAGDHDEAVKMYRVAVAGDPNLILARAHLARFLALAGLPDEAMELVTPGLEKSPKSADLLSVRAIVRGQQGELEAGRQDAQTAVALEPNNPDAVIVLASILWRDGAKDDALKLLTKSIEAAPEELELRLVLAQLLLMAEDVPGAERQLVEIVRLDPGKFQHRASLIQVLVAQGKVDAAIAASRDAITALPDNTDAKLALVQLIASHRSVDEAEKELARFRKEEKGNQDFALSVGRFYELNGKADQAEAVYREVMAGNPTKAQRLAAESRVAVLKLRAGALDEARKLAEDVLKESPTDADALVTRAELALLRGDTGAAIIDLRTALGNEPDSVPLATALARAHLQAGEPELAEQVLRGAVQLKPRDIQARLALAQFLVDSGRVEQARPVLEQLVTEQPNSALALEGLAQLQLANRDPAAALQSASRIQSLLPNSATGYMLTGRIEEAQKRGDAARKAYELAASVDPQAFEPVAALARIDVADGKPQQALEMLEARIGRAPDNARLHALRGEVLLAMDRDLEAAESFATAAKKAPNLVAAYRGQARAYQSAGQPDRALTALQAGLEATNGSALLGLDLALLYDQLGRIDDAITQYEAMLTRDPRQDAAANNLAMLLITRRSDGLSLERAGVLVERFAKSRNPVFLDTRGWVLYKQGRYPEAVAVLEQATARAAQRPQLRYHLGMAQLKAGQRAAARASLEVAVAEGADYQGIDEAREALRSL